MAPEMIQNKPYDYKVDIWALGILLFEMIASQPPFPGATP
jgi:serine/threonine protein kinase